MATTSRSLPLQWPLVGRHEELEQFLATLADERAHGFVIHGAAGVGKTRLADQCLAIADREGRNVARATATEGSRDVPLGALAHLLPPNIADERCDLVAVMAEVRPVLVEGAVNGPLVLFVDDLHLLDAPSATLVAQLVDADLVFLVATVRTGSAVPSGLDALWHRARVRRIDLDDLGHTSVDTLLHLVLGAPVEASTSSEIWTASQGNVLFIRELVLGAIESGHLVDQRGVWRLVGPFVSTRRLHDLVEARLGALGTDAWPALDVLATWEPAPLDMLEAAIDPDVLEVLDRAGLLLVRTSERRQEVTLAHPLYGEILRARMPALTRRRLLGAFVDRVRDAGVQRREDEIRVATASLEAFGHADAALLIRAARLARYGHDFPLVERLGRAAMLDGVTPELGLLVGEALHELGSFTEADAVLTAAEAVASDDEQLLGHIVEMRSRNLMWGLLRHEEALAVNAAVRDRVPEGPVREELTLNEALLLAYSGQPREALALLDALPDVARPRALALRAVARLPALIAVGRCVTAADEAKRGFIEQQAVTDEIAIPGPGVQVIDRIYALEEAGELAKATKLAAIAYEATPSSAPPGGLLWLAFHQGRCALLTGRPQTARRWLAEAVARADEQEVGSPRRLVLAALACAHGALGDADAAQAAAAEIDRLPPSPFVFAEVELGRAWALVAAGHLPGARDVLLAGADAAAGAGYRSSEAWLLHDVARLGDPVGAAPRLLALADDSEGDLVRAYAAHAVAAAAGDGDRLVAAADRFEEIGAMLLAAEAVAEAAQAFSRAGERRAVNAATARSATLADACEGARTPALVTPVVVVPLTARERDIAVLAAGGSSSREIAEQLFLSIRTVDNHLQKIYVKLGISGRRELADALED